MAAGAQVASPAATYPLEAFPLAAELTLLSSISADAVSWPPSFRLTIQRRLGLHTSVALSGQFLADRLSRTGGIGVAGLLAQPVGSLLLEPFIELGGGWTDARVDWGGYEVVDEDGRTEWVEWVRPERGLVLIGGAGASVAGVSGAIASWRLSLGYWRIVGSNGLDRASVRLGASVGWVRRDDRWYGWQLDRQPPAVQLVGSNDPAGDSVQLTEDRLLIVASDESGVARIEVDGRRLAFAPVTDDLARSAGVPATAIVGVADFAPPLGGEDVVVIVRDSAGERRRIVARILPPPDHEPPGVVAQAAGAGKVGAPWVRAVATDRSGIADASLGPCPLTLAPLDPRQPDRDHGAREITAWGAPPGPATLVVRDRAGNEERLAWSAPAAAEEPGPLPLLLDVEAQPGGTRGAASRSVHIQGRVRTTGAAAVSSILVDGRPALLSATRDADVVGFEGWLVAPVATRTIMVEAILADGARASRSVEVREAPASSAGRLRVLVLSADTSGLGEAADALQRLSGAHAVEVLAGEQLTGRRVREALSELQRNTRSRDVALVALDGELLGRPDQVEPLVRFEGYHLTVGEIGGALRGVEGAAVLVSNRLRPGPSWLAESRAAPGVMPAGCFLGSHLPVGAVGDLGDAPLNRVVAALDGIAADQDGDGRILVAELLEFLGVPTASGLLPFDPFAVVLERQVAR